MRHFRRCNVHSLQLSVLPHAPSLSLSHTHSHTHALACELTQGLHNSLSLSRSHTIIKNSFVRSFARTHSCSSLSLSLTHTHTLNINTVKLLTAVEGTKCFDRLKLITVIT